MNKNKQAFILVVSCAIIAILLLYFVFRSDDYFVTDEHIYSNEINISVLSPNFYTDLLRSTERFFLRRYNDGSNDFYFTVDIDEYDLDDLESFLPRFQVRMMAGDAPDMAILFTTQKWKDFVGWTLFYSQIWDIARLGMLANIYDLIDDAGLSVSDVFYENILQAFEMNGRLYQLPFAFQFIYVGINLNAPESIKAKFLEMNNVSMDQLVDLYYHAITEYKNEIDYSTFFHSWFSCLQMVMPVIIHITNYVDFDNGVVNLSEPSFVEFMRRWQFIYQNANDPYRRYYNTNLPLANILQELAHNFMFVDTTPGPSQRLLFLLEGEDIPFIGFIPLVDENRNQIVSNLTRPLLWFGSLNVSGAVSTTGGEVIFPARNNSNYAFMFALELISQANSVDADHLIFGRRSLSTPILRSHAESSFRRGLEFAFDSMRFLGSDVPVMYTGLLLENNRFDSTVIENAIDSLNKINSMPATVVFSEYPDSLRDILINFGLGLISIDQTIREMQTTIELWLMESF